MKRNTTGLLALGCMTAALWAADQTPALDIHYVPTPHPVVAKMLEMAQVGKEDVVYDLGSGDGRIVIAAVKERGAKRGLGVDLDPQRITESHQNAVEAGVEDRAEFRQQNIFETDLSPATVVTLYLLGTINERLRPKLFKELRPGTRVASHAFSMGDWKSDADAMVDHDGHQYSVYYWMIPANVSGRWQVSVPSDGQERRFVIELTQIYQQVAGIARAPAGQHELPEATLQGTAFSFVVPEEVAGQAARFEGRIDGDAITGTVIAEGGENAKFTAKREPGTKQEILPEGDAQPAPALAEAQPAARTSLTGSFPVPAIQLALPRAPGGHPFFRTDTGAGETVNADSEGEDHGN